MFPQVGFLPETVQGKGPSYCCQGHDLVQTLESCVTFCIMLQFLPKGIQLPAWHPDITCH